jgi:hypothetical protein
VLNWLVEEKDITPHIRMNDKIAARRWHPARDGATLYLRGRHSGSSPHTMIGYAINNAMNFGTTLAVYASICREIGRPFIFPRSVAQWNGLVDMTDARMLARHVEWSTMTPRRQNLSHQYVGLHRDSAQPRFR